MRVSHGFVEQGNKGKISYGTTEREPVLGNAGIINCWCWWLRPRKVVNRHAEQETNKKKLCKHGKAGQFWKGSRAPHLSYMSFIFPERCSSKEHEFNSVSVRVRFFIAASPTYENPWTKIVLPRNDSVYHTRRIKAPYVRKAQGGFSFMKYRVFYVTSQRQRNNSHVAVPN